MHLPFTDYQDPDSDALGFGVPYFILRRNSFDLSDYYESTETKESTQSTDAGDLDLASESLDLINFSVLALAFADGGSTGASTLLWHSLLRGPLRS